MPAAATAQASAGWCRCLPDCSRDKVLACTLTGDSGPVSVEASRQQDGSFSCSFTPATGAFYRLELALDGKPLGRGPYSLQVLHTPSMCALRCCQLGRVAPSALQVMCLWHARFTLCSALCAACACNPRVAGSICSSVRPACWSVTSSHALALEHHQQPHAGGRC